MSFCCVGVDGRSRKVKRDGTAGPLWWSRGVEVSRPLLTGAKWCHIVPLSDHLSAWLASTQVIKVSCPSCEIQDHITKGQFGSVFNHIYCYCITGCLFSLLLERVMRMDDNRKFFYSGSSQASDAQTALIVCCSPPIYIYHNYLWCLNHSIYILGTNNLLCICEGNS